MCMIETGDFNREDRWGNSFELLEKAVVYRYLCETNVTLEILLIVLLMQIDLLISVVSFEACSSAHGCA
jgi:hypothetical protein